MALITKQPKRSTQLPLAEHPEPPAWLKGAARAEWLRIVDSRPFAASELTLLANYCVECGVAVEATKQTNELIEEIMPGKASVSLALKIGSDARQRAARLAVLLGLTRLAAQRLADLDEEQEVL